MLEDTSLTYTEITAWLNKELKDRCKSSIKISRSAVGRYALQTKKLSAKLIETREQVRELVKLAKENPDENITEGALQMAMLKLTEKIAMADFDGISDSKATELAAVISRSKAYKDKVYANLKTEYQKGYEQFTKRIMAEIEAHPELLTQLESIAKETLGKVTPKKEN